MLHWTKSVIKGLRDFVDFGLLRNWNTALQKGYYNESNWIKSSQINQPGDAKTYVSMFGQVPLFITTKKIAALVVWVGDSGLTIPEIRIRLFNPSDNVEISPATEQAGYTTTSPKELSVKTNGMTKYLYYSYYVFTLPVSGTYTNADGVLNDRRALAQLEYYDGVEFKLFDTTIENVDMYVKFIELSDGFQNERIPSFNETIPGNFYTSFMSMLTGELTGYSSAVGKRYLNYLIPNPKMLNDYDNYPTTTFINLKDAMILKDICTKNNMWSSVQGANKYSTMSIVFPLPGSYVDNTTVFNAMYEVRQAQENPLRNERLESGGSVKTYSKWYEYKLQGKDLFTYRQDTDTVLNTLNSLFITDNNDNTEDGYVFNIASSSSLPGYEETATSNIYELFRVGDAASGLPIDNVSMSIIKNTLQMPFWTAAINDEVVFSNPLVGVFNSIEISPLAAFSMELRPSAIGDEDVSIPNLHIKFNV
jgi:hypothetical protein